MPINTPSVTSASTGSAGGCKPTDIIKFLAGLPLVSRPIIAKWFRQNPTIETKADASPVTIADRLAETALRAAIAQRFPEDTITGEEFGPDDESDRRGKVTSSYRWIIDPIDGTKAFISGKPVFGTLVGLLHNDLPVAGLVDMPALDECYIGLNGFGAATMAQLNGVVVMPNGQTQLADARLATTSPRALSPARLVDFERLADEVAVTNYGGDCHNYALLAAGHIDLVMEDSLAAHDIMAVAALMLGGGATVTDLAGQPIKDGGSTDILAAATPQLHRAALSVILQTK